MNKCLILVLLTMLLFLSCGNAGSTGGGQTRILVVHSYHIEYAWTKSIDDGIMHHLKDKTCVVKKYFMDTKRNTDENFKIEAGKKALELVNTFKPTVVIATDDNAQQYMGRFLVDRKDVSVVYCGVNNDPGLYNYPAANVTGIRERPFVRKGLNLLKTVVPGIKTVTVFTDKSPTSKGFIDYVTGLELDVEIEKIMETDDLDEWRRTFKTITSDAVITYMYHTVRDQGKPVLPKKVMEWTVEHMDRPSMGFFHFAVEDGVLLGHVESGFEHGEWAARQSWEIGMGRKASEIPIADATRGLVVLNEKTARKLGIDVTPIRNLADRVIR